MSGLAAAADSTCSYTLSDVLQYIKYQPHRLNRNELRPLEFGRPDLTRIDRIVVRSGDFRGSAGSRCTLSW